MKNGFEALKITRQFLNALSDMGIETPTEIQEKAIVPAMSGQDILGIAQTGSGKTLAFLIPCVLKAKYAQGDHPRVLVLAPSKELVIQIFRELEKLIVYTDLRAGCIYGGVGKKAQVEQLQAGLDILVSTPGRFIDLYSYGHIFTRKINTLVLDEADRMMEMGFMPQLRQVLEIIPVKRQNLLFSATFPVRVEDLAAEFLEFPIRIESANFHEPVKELKQIWYPGENFKTKLNLLIYLLKDETWNRVIVFCRTKDAAERVSRYLERRNVGDVRVLHGNKAQNTRINALDAFKAGEIRVLVTTDVTSRGIDIDRVSHVVNFELPKVSEDYLHRIGRTARINREGIAVSMVNKAERYFLEDIETYIKRTIPEASFPQEVQKGDFIPGEQKEINLEIDSQKRRRDPNYQGAFHTRKSKTTKKKRSKK
ncbi:MAG: DEAD/DEAH box helicase [Cryomorphaceae bacterium]|nr:DEAD/DEAH box helicase [Flavobacteriales bacterium]